MQPSPDPADFTHWATDTVRFSDQDAVGHINNVAVAAYVESGRVAFGRELWGAGEEKVSFVLARLAIDYRAQAHYPGDVRIGTRLLAIGRTSFTVTQAVFKDDACIATAEGILVHLDDGVPAPIEGALRAELEALLPA